MTNEQIIELAKQACMVGSCANSLWLATPAEIQRFAELVRNQTLEEAAKVCDPDTSTLALCQRLHGEWLASEIRSLKK